MDLTAFIAFQGFNSYEMTKRWQHEKKIFSLAAVRNGGGALQ